MSTKQNQNQTSNQETKQPMTVKTAIIACCLALGVAAFSGAIFGAGYYLCKFAEQQASYAADYKVRSDQSGGIVNATLINDPVPVNDDPAMNDITDISNNDATGAGAESKRYTMSNPLETFYGEIYYKDLASSEALQPLIQEDEICFQEDTEYQIVWEVPNAMKAEIENGRTEYDVHIEYSFHGEAAAEDCAHIWIKVFSRQTGRLFVGMTSVRLDGEQYWKHCYGKNPAYAASNFDLDRDHLSFSIYTGALPDDGPKVTDDTIYGPLAVKWHIAGLTQDQEFFH